MILQENNPVKFDVNLTDQEKMHDSVFYF